MPRKDKQPISFSWDEGRYLDFWSVAHLVQGVILGILLPLFNFSLLYVVLIGTLLMILWEVAEVVFDIGESFENRVIDIVIGIAGLLIGYLFMPLDNQITFVILIILGIILGVLELQGWRAYNRRLRRRRRKGTQ